MSVDVYPTPADVTLGTMAVQNANAVAITGGTAQLTGTYDGTYTLSSTGVIRCFGVNSLHAAVDYRAAFYTDMQAGGTGRYSIQCAGTAPNYFAGNVGIGTVPTANALTIAGLISLDMGIGIGIAPIANTKIRMSYDRSTSYGIAIVPSADTGGGMAALFSNAAQGVVGSITTTSSATAFNTSSDVRLKHSIEKLVGALGVVQLLNPVSFFWKADNSPGVGFRADELQQLIPEAVTGEPDALNDDGSILPQQVDLSKLVPWLTAALQETIAQVEVLAARVIALEARLA